MRKGPASRICGSEIPIVAGFIVNFLLPSAIFMESRKRRSIRRPAVDGSLDFDLQCFHYFLRVESAFLEFFARQPFRVFERLLVFPYRRRDDAVGTVPIGLFI